MGLLGLGQVLSREPSHLKQRRREESEGPVSISIFRSLPPQDTDRGRLRGGKTGPKNSCSVHRLGNQPDAQESCLHLPLPVQPLPSSLGPWAQLGSLRFPSPWL